MNRYDQTEMLCGLLKRYLMELPPEREMDEEEVRSVFELAQKHDLGHLAGVVLQEQIQKDKEKLFRKIMNERKQGLFKEHNKC